MVERSTCRMVSVMDTGSSCFIVATGDPIVAVS